MQRALGIRVCRPCSAASVPTAWQQEERGRKGADVTSPTGDSAEEKVAASQMAANAPSRSGETHSGGIARKEACGRRDMPLTGAEPSATPAPSAWPCGGAASPRPGERLPAERNNLCEAPGYIRAPPPTTAPPGSRAAAPDGRGGDASGRAPGCPSARADAVAQHVQPPTVF